MTKIPLSVLITTKNEEDNIGRCLDALTDFAHVLVIDSYSDDKTCEIAREKGIDVVLYQWDGAYPKKRQWCLDNLEIPYDWVFWVDADEVVTPALVNEIRTLFENEEQKSGYFVQGHYTWHGKVLRYGLRNNKLALFDRCKFEFPVVDDLDISGMGEIEGHYQPVRKVGHGNSGLGQLHYPVLHYAYEDEAAWCTRHLRYAKWEAEMIMRELYPPDPVFAREFVKKLLRQSYFRGVLTFFVSYFVKFGFFDGYAGYKFALSRMKYCAMVRCNLRK